MIPSDPLRNLGPATILRADARHLPLADDSVDLVVTSPPYFTLRSYQDAGEVCGAVIKRDEIDNGEREGSDEEWTERVEQELGDLLCVIAAICAYEGISLELLMDDVWARNKDRTWK